MALQNNETDSRKVKAVADMIPSSMKKDLSSLKEAYTWFKENLTLDQAPNVLMSFSTGLFSREDEGSGDVNPECALEVGTIIQQSLHGGCFTDMMSSKSKVKNLAHLRKPVQVPEASFVVNDLKLFNRLIADRELPLLEGLAYELTQLPLSLFDHKQQMRKLNKEALAKLLKGYVNFPKIPVATKLIVDGGWLLYQR